MGAPLVINSKITLPGSDIEWAAVRASGPGGQNVNKVSSKIELSFDFESTVAVPDSAKKRLRALARNLLDSEGRVCITSQKTRDQTQNLADARNKLRKIIQQALVVPKMRKPTKPTLGSKRRRIATKKMVGEKKAARRAVDHES
jgi:ribosome-associated protein